MYRKVFILPVYGILLFLAHFQMDAVTNESPTDPYPGFKEKKETVIKDKDFDHQLRSSDDEYSDFPGVFEFYELNTGCVLFENSGNYKRYDPMSVDETICGGRNYNIDARTGDFKRDSIGSPGHVLSFLGINNYAQCSEITNYAIYVDTAYINRGTGWIKPQYMLAVDVYIPEECGECDPSTGLIEGENDKYVIGRYLYNTSMYAKAVADSIETASGDYIYKDKYYDKANGEGIAISADETESGYMYTSFNFNKVQPVKDMEARIPNGDAYLSSGYWERFAFSWAIHKGDSLYVLKGVDLEPMYKGMENDPHQVWMTLTKEYGLEGKYVDFQKLIDYCTTGFYREAYYPAGDQYLYPEMRTFRTFKDVNDYDENHTIGLHAIIALDDNTHKDWVVAFRLTERGVNDFVIESETALRNTGEGAKIRPGYGGWLKDANGVPVITRSDEKDNMGQAAVFNVRRSLSPPVNNEDDIKEATFASPYKVVGGNGEVLLYHAAGKKVMISNMQGQILFYSTVSSDFTTITVQPGIIVVTIDGGKAVKVVVN